MSLKTKVQALLTAANAKTSASDATLTDAVQTLIDGYGQGGGDHDVEDGIIIRTISVYENSRITKVGSFAFMYCSKLTTVSFPACTGISQSAFYSCTNLNAMSFPACTGTGSGVFQYCIGLTAVSFPVCTDIGSGAFYSCYNIATVSFPACTRIRGNAFTYCSKLTTVSFPVCTEIGSSAFYSCINLEAASFPSCSKIYSNAFYTCRKLLSLYLTASLVCVLSNSNAFISTPIAGYTTSTSGAYGSIFVPASLVDAYKSATNWTYFANRITAIPESE